MILVIYSVCWKDHMEHIHEVLTWFAEANVTINLAKSEFGHAEVTFLGHVAGNEQIKPLKAKVQAIMEYPAPTNKRKLMRFLAMVGYYHRFCQNFSTITAPLTNLLRKNQEYTWSTDCQDFFVKVKAFLLSNSVLMLPTSGNNPFILMIDTSDIGAGAVLMQCDTKGVEHPICYFHKNSIELLNHQEGNTGISIGLIAF